MPLDCPRSPYVSLFSVSVDDDTDYSLSLRLVPLPLRESLLQLLSIIMIMVSSHVIIDFKKCVHCLLPFVQLAHRSNNSGWFLLCVFSVHNNWYNCVYCITLINRLRLKKLI